jgi:4-amino-4-deoxy-L-arabinose transferase-like glycosyltransferase
VWLPLAWFALVVGFFSLSAGKRDMYILPALPALALAAAPYLDDIARRRGFRLAVLAFTALLSTVLLAGGVAALAGEPSFETRLVAERGLGPEARWLWGMLAAVGGLGLLASFVAAATRLRGALPACATLLVALWCGYGFVVHPLLDDENSARAVMQRARELAGPGVAIGLVDWKEQNLLQAVGPVAEFGFRAAPGVQLSRGRAWLAQAPGERVLMLQESEALACVDLAAGARRVGTANRRAWWLVDERALAACARPGTP